MQFPDFVADRGRIHALIPLRVRGTDRLRKTSADGGARRTGEPDPLLPPTVRRFDAVASCRSPCPAPTTRMEEAGSPARRPAPCPDRAARRWVTCLHGTAFIAGRWAGGFAAARTAAEVDQRSRLRHGNFRDHARRRRPDRSRSVAVPDSADGRRDDTAGHPVPGPGHGPAGRTRRITGRRRWTAAGNRTVRPGSLHCAALRRERRVVTDPSVGTPPTARAGFCQDRSEDGHRLQNRSCHRGQTIDRKPVPGNVHGAERPSPVGGIAHRSAIPSPEGDGSGRRVGAVPKDLGFIAPRRASPGRVKSSGAGRIDPAGTTLAFVRGHARCADVRATSSRNPGASHLRSVRAKNMDKSRDKNWPVSVPAFVQCLSRTRK